jgi:hypothetical protein
MAAAAFSLNNLSVKPDGQENQGLLMPKLQFRFRMTFLNFGLNDNDLMLTRQVIDITRPNLSFAKITLPVYNSTIYMAGKHTWQPMTANLRDDAGGNVSRLVGEQLQKQLDFVEQASAASAQNYKFSAYIDVLDGGNGTYDANILERWELYGCYLESVNYNTLNYGASEDVRIGLTIQYDNAVQSDGNNSLDGSPAGVGIGQAIINGRQATPADVKLATGVGDSSTTTTA